MTTNLYGVYAPCRYMQVWLIWAWLQQNRLAWIRSRTIRNKMVRSWRVRFNIEVAVNSPTRFGTDNACWGKSRTDVLLKCIISWWYPLIPLFEAKVTNPNSLTLTYLFSAPQIIRCSRDKICCALSTENASAMSTMMSTVKNRELCITLITYPATMVGHPKVPWHIWRFRPPRDPGLHDANQFRECIVGIFHRGWSLSTSLILNNAYAADKLVVFHSTNTQDLFRSNCATSDPCCLLEEGPRQSFSCIQWTRFQHAT